MTLLDDFLMRATLAGIGVALAAGPLGCFVVWRRIAYFGDATAHAALLGIALALISDLPVTLGVLAIAGAFALATAATSGGRFAMDTMLGVFSHAALAIGLVALALLQGVRVDLIGYLFGDVLAVSRGDLLVIWGCTAAILALLAWHWRSLMIATINEELCWAEGGDPRRSRLVLSLLLALLVAVAIKIVGVMLITAMLIVPAAAARPLVRGPAAMALAAAGIGALAVIGGLQASLHLDTPAGPSIVVAAVLVFALPNLATALSRHHANGR